MTNKSLQENNYFSDVKNTDDFFLHAGVYTPFESFFMYPSGIMP